MVFFVINAMFFLLKAYLKKLIYTLSSRSDRSPWIHYQNEHTFQYPYNSSELQVSVVIHSQVMHLQAELAFVQTRLSTLQSLMLQTTDLPYFNPMASVLAVPELPPTLLDIGDESLAWRSCRPEWNSDHKIWCKMYGCCTCIALTRLPDLLFITLVIIELMEPFQRLA